MMSTKENALWPRRAPPDASAGFNMFSGQRTSLSNSEVPSIGFQEASGLQERVVQGNGERILTSRPQLDASADFNVYDSFRNSMIANGVPAFGVPVHQDVVTGHMDGLSMSRQLSGRRPPLDNLLIPRNSPLSSQANSLVFEGSIPYSARRPSPPVRTPTSSQPSPACSYTPSPSGSPSLVARRRASAPNPAQTSPLSRIGGLQPRVPSSPNTGPWHGRSFNDFPPLLPRTPSPSGQHVNDSFGLYTLGGSPYQAPMRPVGSSDGASLDISNMRAPTDGYSNNDTDSGQSLQPSIHLVQNRRHTFPSEFAGSSDMLRDAINRSRSVPGSPGNWLQNTGLGRMSGSFGRFEPSFARSGNDVGNRGSFATPTGYSGRGALEDAITELHFERVVALLEQGFSPNGERGSSETPPLLYAVTTGNERLVKLLLDAGANINGCDKQQFTALHYAAASGHWGIVNILLAAGANIYAKTDSDLLPVQLAADHAVYEYLSARMKSDMEGRMSPRQAKPPSPRPPARPSNLQRFARTEKDQWTGAAWLVNSKGGGYHDEDVLDTGQSSVESESMQPGLRGVERQSLVSPLRQAVGPSLMDWENSRELVADPTSQGPGHRVFTNQSSLVAKDERVSLESNQGIDIWMQDGMGNSQGLLTRPVSAQMLQERIPLQRSSSAPAMSWNKLKPAPLALPELLRQSSDPSQQHQSSSKVALPPRAPNAPAGLGQEVEDVGKNRLQKTKSLQEVSSIEAPRGPVQDLEDTGIQLLDTKHVKEAETSRSSDVPEEGELEDDAPQNPTAEMRKSFTNACDSLAPSMMERFRAVGSGHLLQVQNLEEISSEKVTGTPLAPETPRQKGESQEKPEIREVDSLLMASSCTHKGKEGSVDIRPASALKGDSRKLEKKKSVTFALADSPSKEDLALIREDWHEAARSGCVGCGKAGCEGKCLASQKAPLTLNNEAASCSSSKVIPQDLFTNPRPTRTGSVRWTRGELLGEGAYGKVFAGLNQDTGELMAVKQLKLDTAAEGQERQFYLAALEREIAFYKTMRHKHIVGYIDMDQDVQSGSLYVFLEYVSGGSIQSMLERFGRFSEPLVRVYTRQLLLGLEYLHGKKIVHRDIKGGNVLVDADGIVKLADFGASKAFHDPMQTDGFKSIRGSVFWMAPEVIKGDGYGRRADIWSVGCTVIEMLTAVHPWPGMDNTWTAIFHIAKASSGPPIPDGVSDVVRDFLSHCFQLDPKKRPTSTELLQHPFVAEIPPQT